MLLVDDIPIFPSQSWIKVSLSFLLQAFTNQFILLKLCEYHTPENPNEQISDFTLSSHCDLNSVVSCKAYITL